MPSKSKSQQRLMGWVYSVMRGDTKNAPKKIKDIAKSMKKKDVRDLASTKHKGLPAKIKAKTKKKSSSVKERLISLSNRLDSLGLHKSSDSVDDLLKGIE